MSYHKHKMRLGWGSVLAMGIVAAAIGVFVNYYALGVVRSGPYPAQSVGWVTIGFFFIGLGMGYIVCVPIIRSLEMKMGKMEKELH